MLNIAEELKHSIKGEVRCDPVSRKIYSVDASIYEIEPLLIVLAKSSEDVQHTVAIAAKHGIPLVARGAATGTTGGCIGEGIIVDTSKYFNRILELNPEERYAIVEPGVVQDRLNEEAARFNLKLGAETSTGNRATLGGMLANNAAGAHSLHYGKMVDNILEMDLILSDGSIIRCENLDKEQWKRKTKLQTSEGKIYRTIDAVGSKYRDEIQKSFPKLSRRVSGYNLDELLKSDCPNLSRLIVGSEGSLGFVAKMKVPLVPIPKCAALGIVHFSDLFSSLHAVDDLLSLRPYSLELIDHNILETGKCSPLTRGCLNWIQGLPKAVLVFECKGNSQVEVQSKIERLRAFCEIKRVGYAFSQLFQSEEIANVWKLRKAGLELLLSKRSYSKAIAFIEDIAVPPDRLAPFMTRLLNIFEKKEIQSGIYGHVGDGCIHIRPFFDLRNERERTICRELMREVSDLLLEHFGTMSGEHGDGKIRSWLNEKMFGPVLYQAFKELKQGFDPHNLMNPGKVVSNISEEQFLHNLRRPPLGNPAPAFLDFSREGGYPLSLDLCNGNGVCRKSSGLMCPSFQATGDEYDSTRARAQALRGVIDGTFAVGDYSDPAIAQVLDLCLECKGCKKECPSQIDMAKLKSEFLYQYHKTHPRSLRSRLFAYLPKWNSIPVLPRLIDLLPFQKQFLSLLGIAPQRKLPARARQTFSSWWSRRERRNAEKKAALFIDTFTEFYSPEIGKDAVAALEFLGYEVLVPKRSCCGRTYISKGFLENAQSCAAETVDKLFAYADQKIPILGLEPSCILTIKDDYLSLLGADHVQAAAVAEQAFPIADFLQKENLGLFSKYSNTIHIHGHCHQKSSNSTDGSAKLLATVANTEVSEIPSGCCGMAGSFGYEQEHYRISRSIANLTLLPYLQKIDSSDTVIADGFSCRTQIADFSGIKAVHTVQLLARCIRNEINRKNA